MFFKCLIAVLFVVRFSSRGSLIFLTDSPAFEIFQSEIGRLKPSGKTFMNPAIREWLSRGGRPDGSHQK